MTLYPTNFLRCYKTNFLIAFWFRNKYMNIINISSLTITIFRSHILSYHIQTKCKKVGRVESPAC